MTRPPMTRPVAIFDLDGTLVDTPRAIVDTFAAVFASIGAKAPAPDAIRWTIGLPLEQAFAGLLDIQRKDERVGQAVRRYQELFRDLVLPRAQALVFPGVVQGLAALRDSGFALAVATSKHQASAEALLRAAALRDAFDVVVGADQVSRPKPDPESARLVFRLLGAPAGRPVMVGDTTHDLLMARAAGIASIAVTYGVHDRQELLAADPTSIVDSFDDVPGTIAGLQAEPQEGARA